MQTPTPTSDKVDYILTTLKTNNNRATLAKELGYTNPKSLDIFMRRKGFLYDTLRKNYIPVKSTELTETTNFGSDKRLRTILSLFTKENPDPKNIAQITGFENHIELAEFMKSNNFTWNDAAGNYIRLQPEDPSDSSANIEVPVDASEFYIYLPLLRKLHENKEKLYKLLDYEKSNIHIQDINITETTANFNLSIIESLYQQIQEFQEKSDVPLDKILESAIIEFLEHHASL